MISEHQQLMELMAIVKDDDTNSDHFGPAKPKASKHQVAKTQHSQIWWRCSYLENILGAVQGVDTWQQAAVRRWESSISKRRPEGWSYRARHSRASTDGRHIWWGDRVFVKLIRLAMLDSPGSHSCHFGCSVFKRGQRERTHTFIWCTLATILWTQIHGWG